MRINLVGINHNTTPVAIREKVAIGSEQLNDMLNSLRYYTRHGIILSTCGRTEIYTTSTDGFDVGSAIMRFFTSHLKISETDLSRHVHMHKDRIAVEHLFRIACGLDSMIIGEYEILGQVRQALEAAEKAEMVNLPLRLMFQSAIRAGRRAREETGISKNALSISSVAVELATKVVGELKDCRILVIGAGETGKLVVKAAKERGASRIVVTSRSQKTAAALAATLGGIAVRLENLDSELTASHIVVTCAAAPHRILNAQRVEETMRGRPRLPLVIIDIGVPRNVEPAAAQIDNVFLYNIDALTKISERNRKLRKNEINKVTEIIDVEVAEFISTWHALKVKPTISALMSKAEEIRHAQLKKTLKKLSRLSPEEQNSLEAMTKSIVAKILNDPISCLKAKEDGDSNYAQIISELFQLHPESQK